MVTDPERRGVFVNYRSMDTGWTANVVAGALRQRLGPASQVFLDHRSIGLGTAFAGALEDGIRLSAVLVVLIGPRWDAQPLVGRLADPEDWVRKEILLAQEIQAAIIPVLVDRDDIPEAGSLPEALRFVCALQVARIRQHDDRDPAAFAEQVACLLPSRPANSTTTAVAAGRTRSGVDALLRRILPPAQQWMGNRERLLELTLAVLNRDDRLIFLAVGRINDGPKGSATVFLTDSDIIFVEVNEKFALSGEIRFPRNLIRRVEVVPILPLFADILLRTTAGDAVRLQGLFRDQARQLADQLRL